MKFSYLDLCSYQNSTDLMLAFIFLTQDKCSIRFTFSFHVAFSRFGLFSAMDEINFWSCKQRKFGFFLPSVKGKLTKAILKLHSL